MYRCDVCFKATHEKSEDPLLSYSRKQRIKF